MPVRVGSTFDGLILVDREAQGAAKPLAMTQPAAPICHDPAGDEAALAVFGAETGVVCWQAWLTVAGRVLPLATATKPPLGNRCRPRPASGNLRRAGR